ncbi:MAG: magnesium transporter CorA family protein [Geminicoccaceae bacterium]|nr:magnesium transporter CorA family protein [Geminicoccaceae bacterium]
MLQCYDTQGRRHLLGPEEPIGPDAVWLDLHVPNRDEVRRVEALLGIEMPTVEEMAEIEVSSRLYREDDAVFMTASVLSKSEGEAPTSQAVSFVVGKGRLVTLRHSEPKPFQTYCQNILRHHETNLTAELVLAGLLDAIVDRLADILETASAEMDRISGETFARSRNLNRVRDYSEILGRIGRCGNLIAKVKESLVSLGRLVAFASLTLTGKSNKALTSRLKTVARDIVSLNDHVNYLSNNVTFVLDATLGFISIEQSAIIKIFSVVTFIFLPPTLVASIYGMNFRVMPELDWSFGYPMALGLMVVSAVLPWLFFKRRGWL